MMDKPIFSAVIVAAGKGTRLGGPIPKQYQDLKGMPVLARTIRAVLSHPKISEVCVVIADGDQGMYQTTVENISDPRLLLPVIGGDTRSKSVSNGLNAVTGEFVLIHDGARPLISKDDLTKVIDGLVVHNAVFLALPVTDAIWSVEDGMAITAQPRDTFWRAQTPQAFRLNDIKAAHSSLTSPADDDVAAARRVGIDVVPILGSEQNIKITHQGDLQRAEVFMGVDLDVRTGTGYDVHALGAGDHVILNGIPIPHTHAMIGHSDADVAMHAITDALFGALAEGDIGHWFPPSENEWKGAASSIFLEKAVERCAERGFKISNIDCTIICELPKIGPHAQAMRENLANIIGIDIDRVSIKATTSEKLGFTGRGEGIAAQAAATLVSL
jgi:2-C-methyl-D-erythritol 4-phosphate cytidylyltransferase/2-C-methyl-D-erythritol 2,4-cyclodiphosphate synthase